MSAADGNGTSRPCTTSYHVQIACPMPQDKAEAPISRQNRRCRPASRRARQKQPAPAPSAAAVSPKSDSARGPPTPPMSLDSVTIHAAAKAMTTALAAAPGLSRARTAGTVDILPSLSTMRQKTGEVPHPFEAFPPHFGGGRHSRSSCEGPKTVKRPPPPLRPGGPTDEESRVRASERALRRTRDSRALAGGPAPRGAPPHRPRDAVLHL